MDEILWELASNLLMLIALSIVAYGLLKGMKEDG